VTDNSTGLIGAAYNGDTTAVYHASGDVVRRDAGADQHQPATVRETDGFR
jgi:hypothetical protein